MPEGGNRSDGLGWVKAALSTLQELPKVNWDDGVTEEASQEEQKRHRDKSLARGMACGQHRMDRVVCGFIQEVSKLDSKQELWPVIVTESSFYYPIQTHVGKHASRAQSKVSLFAHHLSILPLTYR